jgi:hypothetical protein
MGIPWSYNGGCAIVSVMQKKSTERVSAFVKLHLKVDAKLLLVACHLLGSLLPSGPLQLPSNL